MSGHGVQDAASSLPDGARTLPTKTIQKNTHQYESKKKYINWIVVFAAMLALLAASLVLSYSVVVRYLFKSPTDWQDEFAVFLLVGATFGCGATVQAHRGHVGIGVLEGLLPTWADAVRTMLVDSVSAAFCGFFAWKSWTLCAEAWREGRTTSSTWAPPLWIPYSLMAAGMSLLVMQILCQILLRLTASKQPVTLTAAASLPAR